MEDNDQIDLSLFSEKVWPNIKEIYRDEAPATDTEKPAEASSVSLQFLSFIEGNIITYYVFVLCVMYWERFSRFT